MHRTRKRLLARTRVRKTLALFTGGLLAAATLTLGSAPGGASPALTSALDAWSRDRSAVGPVLTALRDARL
ncbi:hypothetical protein ABZ609_36065, partial [Streptomyces rubiginosohelvolus]